MNKKIIAGIVALTLTLSSGVSAGVENIINTIDAGTEISASAEDFGDFSYTVIDKQAKITAYNGDGGYVEVPDVINGLPVTFIDALAFSNNNEITGISLPDTVSTIENGAFEDCSNLESVRISDGIVYIGTNAFKDCTSLKTVKIGTIAMGLKGFSIMDGTFEGCTSLTSVTIPERTAVIRPYAFHGCTSLKKINIPYGVQRIEYYAFKGCENLNSVTFPETLETVGKQAFVGCTGLDSVFIPENVKNIGDKAFGYADASEKTEDFRIIAVAQTQGEFYAKANGFEYNIDLEKSGWTLNGIKKEGYKYTGKAVKPAISLVVANKTLKKGTDYTYTITNNVNAGKAVITIKGKGVYTGTLKYTFNIIPKTPKAAVKATSPTSIRLKWNKCAGVEGYRIYQYDGTKKKWVKIQTIKNPSATECRVVKLKSAALYKFKVKSYGRGGVECESPKAISAVTRPVKGVVKAVKSYGYRSVTARWKESKGADGYQLQITSNSQLKGGKYIDIKKGNIRYSYWGRPLVSGRKYYVRIRAYKTLDGVKHFGLWSKEKTVKSN